MSFADKLVECRTKLGISQRELANRLGVTPVRLNYWEKGKREPDVYYIKALARELGVTGDYLLETPFAERLDELPEEAPLSEEATKVAKDYDSLNPVGKSIVRGVLDTACAYLRQSGASGADDPYEPEIRREIVATKQLIDKPAK